MRMNKWRQSKKTKNKQKNIKVLRTHSDELFIRRVNNYCRSEIFITIAMLDYRGKSEDEASEASEETTSNQTDFILFCAPYICALQNRYCTIIYFFKCSQ